MVALHSLAKAYPAMFSQVWKDNILFPINVFFHSIQMLGYMSKSAKFRVEAGQMIQVSDGLCDIVQISQEASNQVMLGEQLWVVQLGLV